MTHISATQRVFSRDPRHRRPRPADDPGWRQIGILSPVPTDPPTGSVYSCFAPRTATWPADPQTVTFGAWSLTDGSYSRADGPIATISDRAGTPPNTSLVAWYFGPGGVEGPGSTSLIVDELLVTTQSLLDDDFVTVEGDDALSIQANNDGWVPTDQARVLSAATEIGSLPIAFDRWLYFGADPVGPEPGRAEFDVPAGASGLALAAYTMPVINDVSGYPQYVPHLDLSEAVLLALIAQNPPAGSLGTTIANLAANALMRQASASLNADNAASIHKILVNDEEQTLSAELKNLGQ